MCWCEIQRKLLNLHFAIYFQLLCCGVGSLQIVEMFCNEMKWLRYRLAYSAYFCVVRSLGLVKMKLLLGCLLAVKFYDPSFGLDFELAVSISLLPPLFCCKPCTI